MQLLALFQKVFWTRDILKLYFSHIHIKLYQKLAVFVHYFSLSLYSFIKFVILFRILLGHLSFLSSRAINSEFASFCYLDPVGYLCQTQM